MVIEIDYSKAVNDSYGHIATDKCLKVANAIAQVAGRETDVVARCGAETNFGAQRFLLGTLQSQRSTSYGILFCPNRGR